MQTASKALDGERDERPARAPAGRSQGPEQQPSRAARFHVPDAPIPGAAVRPERLSHNAFANADLRQELGARTEVFRARWLVLRTEREAHYAGAIARVRAITSKWENEPVERSRASDPLRAPTGPVKVDEAWDKIWQGIELMTKATAQRSQPDD